MAHKITVVATLPNGTITQRDALLSLTADKLKILLLTSVLEFSSVNPSDYVLGIELRENTTSDVPPVTRTLQDDVTLDVQVERIHQDLKAPLYVRISQRRRTALRPPKSKSDEDVHNTEVPPNSSPPTRRKLKAKNSAKSADSEIGNEITDSPTSPDNENFPKRGKTSTEKLSSPRGAKKLLTKEEEETGTSSEDDGRPKLKEARAVSIRATRAKSVKHVSPIQRRRLSQTKPKPPRMDRDKEISKLNWTPREVSFAVTSEISSKTGLAENHVTKEDDDSTGHNDEDNDDYLVILTNSFTAMSMTAVTSAISTPTKLGKKPLRDVPREVAGIPHSAKTDRPKFSELSEIVHNTKELKRHSQGRDGKKNFTSATEQSGSSKALRRLSSKYESSKKNPDSELCTGGRWNSTSDVQKASKALEGKRSALPIALHDLKPLILETQGFWIELENPDIKLPKIEKKISAPTTATSTPISTKTINTTAIQYSPSNSPSKRVTPSSPSLQSLSPRNLLSEVDDKFGILSSPEDYRIPPLRNSHAKNGTRNSVDDEDRPLFVLEREDKHVTWYTTYFANEDHMSFIGRDKTLGPYVVSIVKAADSSNISSSSGGNINNNNNNSNENSTVLRVILRTKHGDQCKLIADKSRKFGKIIQKSTAVESILKKIDPDLNRQNIRRIKENSVVEELRQFEHAQVIKTFKFGVLYVREGQSSESEMFANQHASSAFKDFLKLLGHKVQLKGWPGYGGGLDTEKDSTGTKSYFTDWRGLEIMFHVSTLLPWEADDPQHLARKRHIGNDIVLIIFKEGNTSYNPNTVQSTFNHIFVVVQPIIRRNSKNYRISITCKDTVPSFGPELPPSGLFNDDEVFREFLLTKLVNGERAAYISSGFASRLAHTRLGLLTNFERKYYTNAKD